MWFVATLALLLGLGLTTPPMASERLRSGKAG